MRYRVTWPGGSAIAGSPEAHVEGTLAFHDVSAFSAVLAYGNLGLGEAFADEKLSVSGADLADVLTALLRNRVDQGVGRDGRLAFHALFRRASDLLRGNARNVRSHYDLGDDLFETFLDDSMTYSCGYALTGEDSLEDLQRQKLERVCQKLRLVPGERLVDIGCGFGGLLLHAAKNHGVTGVGVTLSERHAARAKERIADAGLEHRIEIRCADFRSLEGPFHKVVSVGMLEHLRAGEYRGYFRKIAALLRPGGLALVHTIGCGASRNEHDPFIQKYIFPGSSQPKLSEIAGELERNGMALLDVENLVRHYAPTGERWLARYRENHRTLDPARYPPRFQRLFEYYLACVVAAARASDGAVYQVLFTNDWASERPWKRV